jgi:hypothetical protein
MSDTALPAPDSDPQAAPGAPAPAPPHRAAAIEGDSGSPFGELGENQEQMELAPESFPAFDDPPEPPPPPRRLRTRWLPWAVVALILVGLGIAYVLLRTPSPEVSDSDLLHRLIESTDSFRPELATLSDAEALDYLVERFGWPITSPAIPGMQMVGVGSAALSETVEVPGFRFDHANGETAVVFAYDYVFLDQVRDQFTLPEAVYAQLGDANPVDTRRLGDAYLVSWRNRAVIYTAVTFDEATFESIGQGVR